MFSFAALVVLCYLQGPCRRKLDGVIQKMRDAPRIMALSIYLPNCDRKGFFKRKQVLSHKYPHALAVLNLL